MINLDKVPDLASMSDAHLLKYLEKVAADLGATNTRGEALYALRLRIYQEARSRKPAVPLKKIGDASGMTDVTVIRTLKKAEAATAIAAQANGIR